MANLIKMDLRRLFLSKVFYITMGIVAFLNIVILTAIPLLTKMFAPGECIPDGLPKEKAGWLLSANAVCWYPDAGEEPATGGPVHPRTGAGGGARRQRV